MDQSKPMPERKSKNEYQRLIPLAPVEQVSERYTGSVLQATGLYYQPVTAMIIPGTPNKLAVFGPENEQRLGDFMRTDLNIEYRRQFSFGKLKASTSVAVVPET